MTKPPSPRPLSIKLIAVMFVVTALRNIFVLPSFLPQLPSIGSEATAVGFSLHGWPAFFYHLVVAVLFRLVLGIGLWRLREQARHVAILYQGYLIVDTLLTEANPVTRTKKMFDLFLLLVLPMEMGFRALLLWLLITRKAAFGKPPTPPLK